MTHDRITPGSTHPNRPLPSSEVFVTADSVLMEHAPGIVQAAEDGITDVTSMMHSPIRVRIIGSRWADGEYGSTQWFTERAGITDPSGTHSGKLLYDVIHRDLASDPALQESPHVGYMLLGQDLTAIGPDGKPMNFIFGATDKEIGQSVQSIARFLEAGLDSAQLATVTRHIARHEFGHLIGLDGGSIRSQDSRGGIYQGHCVNTCTMRQVSSVPEAVDLAESLKDAPHAGFCDDCTSVIVAA
ncbi:hypothetical protein KC973_03270 [Candidatus Saccharibacteria bacterium]|nr:hypothetical protein [Candidatus Saccharibacteria bacterium]